MESSKKRVVFLYTAFQFFFSLLVWIPVFYEYQKLIGLNDTQIFRIQSIYYLFFCFLEIPTGYLADRLGYKRCLKWGAYSLIFANLLPIFAQNYGGFLTHFLLIAVSRSFISGASAAYIYDYLAQNNSAAEYKKIEGSARAWGLAGKVVCWAAVGALMKWHLTLPYWMTTLSAVIATFYAYALPDITKTQKTPATTFEGLAVATRYVFSNAYVFFIILQGVGIFTLTRIVQVNLFQPILKEKQFDLVSFGWIMSLMTLFEALGSAYPHKLQRWMNDRRAVTFTTLLLAVSLILIPFGNQIEVVASLLLFSIGTGLSFPIQKQLINDAIQGVSEYRATILSLESIVDRAVCAWVASLIGVSLSGGGLDRFLISSGLICAGGILFLSIIFLYVKRRRRQKASLQLNQGAAHS